MYNVEFIITTEFNYTFYICFFENMNLCKLTKLRKSSPSFKDNMVTSTVDGNSLIRFKQTLTGPAFFKLGNRYSIFINILS